MAVATTRIRDLIIKRLKEEITEEENQELQAWAHRSQENATLFNQLMDPDFLKEALQESSELKLSIRNKIDRLLLEDERSTGGLPLINLRDSNLAHLSLVETKEADFKEAETDEGTMVYLSEASRPRRPRVWIYAAAACLLLLFGGSYLWLNRSSHPAVAAHLPILSNDVAPGGDKAILTLGNDSTIVLESAANGNLAVQGVSRVSKDKNLLAYTAANLPSPAITSPTSATALVYNTLTTPRAGQFQLILPDGSKVRLNNASSLRYPTSFTGKTREVSLSGEAYFEIAKDAMKPFIVRVNGLAVNVLGTSFNIMAYGDEPLLKTTLLTGKVSLAAGSKQSVLAPGEQAAISKDGSLKIAKGVDLDEATAWQRGYFHFSHEDIAAVLRQLSRWYDVEVAFTIPIPDYTFDGEIDRTLSLSSILRHLEKTDLHFQIDGRKLIVSK
jgi:transmembrane sensor